MQYSYILFYFFYFTSFIENQKSIDTVVSDFNKKQSDVLASSTSFKKEATTNALKPISRGLSTRGTKLMSELKENFDETRSLFDLKEFEQPITHSRRIDDCFSSSANFPRATEKPISEIRLKVNIYDTADEFQTEKLSPQTTQSQESAISKANRFSNYAKVFKHKTPMETKYEFNSGKDAEILTLD